MAQDASGESFGDRLMTFYDACSEEERLFLAWLFSFSPDALATVGEPDVEGFGGPLVGAPHRGPEPPLSFNVQYFQVQDQLQQAGVSNVLKTRHDTAKNSISNIR